jgi:ribosomal protein S18 acetylase RimI-like enzyme
MDFKIRLFRSEDTDRIKDLNISGWSGEITSHQLLEERHGRIDDRPWQQHITDAVMHHLSLPDVTTFVAEQDGRVIGFAAGQIKSDGSTEVGTVSYNVVDPAYRGNGIGTILVRQVIQHLRQNGARVLNVWTQEADVPACRMYEKLGFKQLSRLVFYSQEM